MMKTEYILFNYDVDEPLFISEDKGLLEEIMYDMFFEDAYFDFCWSVRDTSWDVSAAADDCWMNCLSFYEDYIDIVEAPKI